MYNSLLNNLDQEVYELFSYLLANDFRYGSLSELAKKLKHTRSRMNLIIDRAKELQAIYPAYTIEITDTAELSINLSSEFLLSKLYALMLKETIPFKILDRLFSERYVSLEKTAQYYYLSNRTVQRKLKELNTILSNYDVSLDLKSKTLFKGEEYRIRYFFHTMYWQIFDETHKKNFDLTKTSIEKLKQTLKKLPTLYRHIDQEKFIQIVALSFYRIKRKHMIKELPEEMTKIKHLNISYEVFREDILKSVIKENYMVDKLPETEYQFLYYMFSVMTTYLPEEITEQGMRSLHLDTDSWRTAEIFAKTTQQFFNLPINVQDKRYLILNAWIIHSSSKVFSSENKIDAFGKTTTEKDYIRVFPDLYLKVKELYFNLANQSEIFEQLYHANNRLIFQYCMLISLLVQKQNRKIKVFHESKFGKVQDARQKKQMRQLLGEKIIFVNEDPEIVITDYPVDQQKYLAQNNKVQFFKWHSFQTTEKWIELLDFFENYK